MRYLLQIYLDLNYVRGHIHINNVFIYLSLDDPELDAQVPAPVPPGAGQRHHAAALLHLQNLCFQGVRLHCGHRLSKREGHPAQD